jgi:exosortase/archaeosortase family protein
LDLVVAAVFLLLVILPIYAVSWVAVTGLSLYILLFANDGPERRRGALILLALTVPMLWSRLVFQFFAKPLLELDATMVAWLLGTERIGNLVRFGDNSGYMLITPACASFGNITFAFLTWVTVSQWANHRWARIDLLWSFLACASVVAINVTRIAITGLSYGHYETIHNQWGEMVLSTVFLILIVGFSVIGARRELFSRA